MWATSPATLVANSTFLLLFLPLWSVGMGSYLYFWLRVAPAALQRWADAEGYTIIERKRAGIVDRSSFAGGNGHYVFQVLVRDREGREHRGLVRVGTPYWFCISVSRCPVEVRWGEATDTLGRFRSLADPKRIGWRGGASARGQAVIRRTVLVFAVVDLALATLLLVVEAGILLAIAVGVDEVWNGSLGLNRYFGRTPRPELVGETRMFIAQALGFLALYLPALVTLAVGGVGLILRRPWGYSAHLAGSALVAVTCFGIIYTIPALAFALQPEFKGYVRGPGVTTPPGAGNGVRD